MFAELPSGYHASHLFNYVKSLRCHQLHEALKCYMFRNIIVLQNSIHQCSMVKGDFAGAHFSLVLIKKKHQGTVGRGRDITRRLFGP